MDTFCGHNRSIPSGLAVEELCHSLLAFRPGWAPVCIALSLLAFRPGWAPVCICLQILLTLPVCGLGIVCRIEVSALEVAMPSRELRVGISVLGSAS